MNAAAQAHPVSQRDPNKAFADHRARLAMAGYELHRTNPADGLPAYFVTRWNLVRELRDLDAVAAFCRQVGAE